MRIGAACLLLLAACGKPAGPPALPPVPPPAPAPVRGLSAADEAVCDGLVAEQTEEGFDDKLGKIVATKKPSAILIVTEAMFRLPWVKELEPKSRYDLRMRKIRATYVLDKMVRSSEHDRLRAAYCRAVEGDGDPAKTAEQLRRWTIDRLDKFVWSEEDKAFTLPEKESD